MNFINTIRSWIGPIASASVYPVTQDISFSQTLSAENALSYTPVWRAVTLLSNDIARCDYTSSPLLQNPNTMMSRYAFWQTVMMQVLLHGNSFSVIQRDGFGQAVELWPIDPWRVTLQRTVNGGLIYKIKDIGDIPPEDIIHIKFGSVSGLWGESPIAMNKTSLSLGVSQENYLLAQSVNGGGNQLVISHPGRLNEDARRDMTNEFKKNHAGPQNGGKPMILSEDSKVFSVSQSIADAGLHAARSRSIEDVGRIYGIPSFMLGEIGSSAYGGLEAQNRAYLDHCLSPWFASIAQEVELKLQTKMIYDLDLFRIPPLAELMAALRTGIEAGLLTKNEARDYLDLPPVPEGDEFNQALNLGAGGGKTNIGTDTSKASQGDAETTKG
jgi:HK97 family phage portal protein